MGWISPTDASDRIDIVTGAAQIIGALALLLGLYFTYRSVENSRETLNHSQKSLNIDRFFNAVNQLGPQSSIDVRVGAIYALGALADDADEHYEQVIEVIVHFLRRSTTLRTITQDVKDQGAQGDIQAAIRTLAQRRAFPLSGSRASLDLSDLHLRDYDFHGGWFESCDFSRSDLSGSNFSGAVLHAARFKESICVGCDFDGAGLINVWFRGTVLRNATFYDPHPSAIQKLFGHNESPVTRLAFLYDPRYNELKGRVGRQGDRLRGVHFNYEDLKNTSFYNTNLSETYELTQEQIAEALTDETTTLRKRLPSQAEIEARPKFHSVSVRRERSDDSLREDP